jgi:tetratricopeptide (TPR) repeat protein
MLDRVLREYGPPLQTTIERLSVARRFDREAFRHAVQTFVTGLHLDSFDRIAELSSVAAGDDGFLAIHNAVAEIIRETLFDHYAGRAKASSAREVSDATVAALAEAAFLRRAKSIEGYATWLESACQPMFEAARYLSGTRLWWEALGTVEASLGPEHPETGTCLNNLAFLLHEQGDFIAARPLCERELTIREKALGPEHPETATSLVSLASLLQDQGDLTAARPLYKRALAIRETALGLAMLNSF